MTLPVSRGDTVYLYLDLTGNNTTTAYIYGNIPHGAEAQVLGIAGLDLDREIDPDDYAIMVRVDNPDYVEPDECEFLVRTSEVAVSLGGPMLDGSGLLIAEMVKAAAELAAAE